MTELNNDYCSICRNRGTTICQICICCQSPSGKVSQPSQYEPGAKPIAWESKPPIGVKPRYIHDEQRSRDLTEAIVRYLNEGLTIPSEWVDEYNELKHKTKGQDSESE